MKSALIIGIIGILILGYFGFSLFVANKLTVSIHKQFTEKPESISSDYENITLPTADGLTLKGWFFPNNNAQNVIILVPGLNFNRVNLDYGAVDIAKDLLAEGFAVIMYDPRGTGESNGNRNGFGSTDWQDINAAISYAKSQNYFSQNIALVGDSNGAISILNSADKFSDIGAIVADSAGTEMLPLIEKGLVDNKIPSLFFPGIFFLSKHLFGADIASVKPIDGVKKVPDRVFLFLHGDKDSLIPVSNSQALLKAANPQSKLVVFPGAEHVLTYKTDPELYKTEVFNFLSTQLGK